MEEIKLRIQVIRGFISGECNALYKQTTVESICVQIRKILELIAMATLVANKEEYCLINDRFHKEWNAQNILKDIEKINVNFYPQPIKILSSNKNEEIIEVKNLNNNSLSRSEFVELYKKCGGLLHANNPFAESKKIDEFLSVVPSWVNKIIDLLDSHSVHLSQGGMKIWVIMNNPKDGKVHATLMSLQ